MATSVLQSRLKLPDLELALLLAPAKYVDCRRPLRSLSLADTGGEVQTLMSLRLTGYARAYKDGDKSPVRDKDAVLETLAELQALPYGRWQSFKRIELDLEDERGEVATMNVFAPLTWRTRVVTNPEMSFIGTVQRFGPRLYISADLTPPAHAIGGIWTRYAGIAGQVAADTVTEAVRAVLNLESAYLKAEREIVSALQLEEAAAIASVQSDLPALPHAPRFASLRELLKGLHMPKTMEEGERALQLAHRISAAGIRTAARSQSIRQPHPQAPLIVPDEQVLALAATQPEALTDDQRAAALGIAKALRSPVPMNGLLSGDVGTGKTLTYLLAAVAAHKNGAVVAIVAPTFILANQIAGQIAERFGSQIRGVERVGTGKKVRNPDHILVGTSGIITSCARSNVVPHFVILDEQHKLSVATRSALVGPSTHVLEASATPIPRSLATVFFDGMQVFTLRQAPVQRQITSHVVDVEGRGLVSRAMRQAVADGRRVLIVYPRLETIEITQKAKAAKAKGTKDGEQVLISDSAGTSDMPEVSGEESDRSAQGVLEAAGIIERSFPGKVAVLHGKMSDGEKELVIDQVKRLEKPVLVASVVVETGIDIPDIGMLLIRDANYFGLSQLHQLRGRLARKGGAADCFMMVESLDDVEQPALERLFAARSTTDGYLLAEMDLRQRGFGSYVDDGQSGATRGVFRLVNLKPSQLLDGAEAAENAGRSEADAARADRALSRVVTEIEEMKRQRGLSARNPAISAAPLPPATRPPGSISRAAPGSAPIPLATRPPAQPAAALRPPTPFGSSAGFARRPDPAVTQPPLPPVLSGPPLRGFTSFARPAPDAVPPPAPTAAQTPRPASFNGFQRSSGTYGAAIQQSLELSEADVADGTDRTGGDSPRG